MEWRQTRKDSTLRRLKVSYGRSRDKGTRLPAGGGPGGAPTSAAGGLAVAAPSSRQGQLGVRDSEGERVQRMEMVVWGGRTQYGRNQGNAGSSSVTVRKQNLTHDSTRNYYPEGFRRHYQSVQLQ